MKTWVIYDENVGKKDKSSPLENVVKVSVQELNNDLIINYNCYVQNFFPSPTPSPITSPSRSQSQLTCQSTSQSTSQSTGTSSNTNSNCLSISSFTKACLNEVKSTAESKPTFCIGFESTDWRRELIVLMDTRKNPSQIAASCVVTYFKKPIITRTEIEQVFVTCEYQGLGLCSKLITKTLEYIKTQLYPSGNGSTTTQRPSKKSKISPDNPGENPDGLHDVKIYCFKNNGAALNCYQKTFNITCDANVTDTTVTFYHDFDNFNQQGGKSRKSLKYEATSKYIVNTIKGVTRKRKIWVNKRGTEFVRIKIDGKYTFKRI